MRPPPMKCTTRSWCSASRPPPRQLRAEPRIPADVARKLAGGERSGWSAHLDALVASGRATRFRAPGGGPVLWCAAERLAEIEAALGGGRADPPLMLPEELRTASGRDAALAELLRARLGCLGPVTAVRLASDLGLTAVDVDVALVGLEAEGCVLRGRFTSDAASIEWCERRLLARIHRYTLGRLRREIEPVSRAEFVRFLFEWQRVKPDDRREGDEALAAVVAELEGFAAPAAAWESEILPARIVGFTPDMLDRLCLAGRASRAPKRRHARLFPTRRPHRPGSTEPEGFTLQIVALRGRAEAGAIVEQLAAKGYPAYVVAPAPNAPARVYRVRVGRYRDLREAEQVRRRLEREEQFKPWITR